MELCPLCATVNAALSAITQRITTPLLSSDSRDTHVDRAAGAAAEEIRAHPFLTSVGTATAAGATWAAEHNHWINLESFVTSVFDATSHTTSVSCGMVVCAASFLYAVNAYVATRDALGKFLADNPRMALISAKFDAIMGQIKDPHISLESLVDDFVRFHGLVQDEATSIRREHDLTKNRRNYMSVFGVVTGFLSVLFGGALMRGMVQQATWRVAPALWIPPTATMASSLATWYASERCVELLNLLEKRDRDLRELQERLVARGGTVQRAMRAHHLEPDIQDQQEKRSNSF